MKNIHDMNRTEVIHELARHAHPTWYHSIISWSTRDLKALLNYYRAGGELPRWVESRIYPTKGLGDTPPPEHAQRRVIHIVIGRA